MGSFFLGDDVKKLGFGLMRLPVRDGAVDIALVKEMVDLFLSRGFTYFDTAYVYMDGKSESIAKEVLTSRYPRDAYHFATKLPVHLAGTADKAREILDTELQRVGVDYFDLYLLHNAADNRLLQADKAGLWDFMKEVKGEGKVRHIGFSYHGKADVLDRILTEHPEVEFVQLQINYLDWEDGAVVQSRQNYDVCRKHDVPVIVMEPVKGGMLVELTPEITGLYHSILPDASTSSWALRFAASLDGVMMVLSGMSDLAQIDDNTKTLGDFCPLTEEQRAAAKKAADILRGFPTLPCTDCRYCVPECPQNIFVPKYLTVYNNYMMTKHQGAARRSYQIAANQGVAASECLACGACEAACPQHIGIIEGLRRTVEIASL